MSSNEEFTDYYAMLGITPGATSGEIRAAYLKGAKEHHPDAGGSVQKMHELSQAYKTLASERSRVAYNKLYELYTGNGDGIDWREHDKTPKHSKRTKATDNDDLFVDQLYSEYYIKEKQSLLAKLKGLFS